MSMSNLSFGDLAFGFRTRLHTHQIKSDLERLSYELSSGTRADFGTAVAGDYGPIAGIEHGLGKLASYETATAEAAMLIDVAQVSLGTIHDMSQDLAPALLAAGNSNSAATMDVTGTDALEKFDMVVGALNAQAGGRTIFAGAASDRAPLVGAEDIMAELRLAVAGETTAAGVAAAIDDWFNAPGGGFETIAYQGSDTDLGPLRLGDDQSVRLQVRADDTAIRNVLASYAMGALVAEDVPSTDIGARAALARMAGEKLLLADGGFTTERAGLGSLQARIEDAIARNAAEKSALELARLRIVGVDPYEAASALEAAIGQLETLYTVTSRVARLTFTDFVK